MPFELPSNAWATPTRDEILEMLSGGRRSNVQQLQPSYADQLQEARQTLAQNEQEQRDSKEMIDGLMERSIPQLQQPPQISPPKAPNPLEINMLRCIVGAKTDYAGAKDDAQRQTAANRAEFLRQVASDVDFDLSGYGSDVSLEDAKRNLASRQARDIVEALSGKYSKTSDEYYQEKLLEGAMYGFSGRRGEQYALEQTKKYQANRMNYLNGAFNSYGRDGRVVNDLGNQILGLMANENPILANFYAQIYPNQQQAYNRENQLEDIALNQTNAFGRMAEQYRLNQLAEDERQKRGQEDYTYRKDLDNQYTIEGETRADSRARNNAEFMSRLKEKEDERAYQAKLSRAEALAGRLGFAGDEKKKLVAAAMGINLAGKDGKTDEDSLKNLKTLHDMLGSHEKNLSDEIKAHQENFDADPNTLKELQSQLAGIKEQREILERTYGALIGATDGETVDRFTGDFNKDKALINEMREEGKRRGLTAQQIKEAIFKYMISQGVDEKYAKGAVGLD